MALSLKAGKRVVLDHVGLFADGVAVRQVGEETFRLCQELVDEMILVDTDAICAAIKDVFEDTRAVLEPAGALAIAGAKAWVEKKGVSTAAKSELMRWFKSIEPRYATEDGARAVARSPSGCAICWNAIGATNRGFANR